MYWWLQFLVVFTVGALIIKILSIVAGYVLSWIYVKIRIVMKKKMQGKVSSDNLGAGNYRGTLFNSFKLFLDGVLKYTIKYTAQIPSHFIRKWLYRYVYKIDTADKVVIYSGVQFRDPWKLKIGKGSIIGDDNILDARNGLIIGENVNLSSGVWIWTGQHSVQSPQFEYVGAPVVIEDLVWLGGRVIVLPGVCIGEGAVVASGAVVTKNLEAYGIYAGIPARKIADRNKNLQYVFDGQKNWFI